MSPSRVFLSDLVFLWKHETRSFLAYIVEVSSPVAVDEWDQKCLDVFREIHEEERVLLRRAMTLFQRIGATPDRPPFDMLASQYNFLRGSVLARAFLQILDPEIPVLNEIKARYADSAELEGRLLRDLVSDHLALWEEGRKRIKGALDAMGRAQAPTTDGGVVAEEVAPAAAEGEFPWHNEDLALAERMKLADGKGLFEKLFAAMAQTDCTACGYDCEGYARAIADGEDTDLTKCAPGELETQETLEKLMGKK